MKRLSFAIVLAFAFVLLFGGAAYANFGPHGGYATDTDSCAGCHRAHTSFSTITWQDTALNNHSALLVSSASTIREFCLACHGDDAPGASTNVQSGIFDSGPTSGIGSPVGAYQYASASTFNAGLNGGGFDVAPLVPENATGSEIVTATFGVVTSQHDMDKGAATDPMWGAGVSAPAGTNNTCTSCHDVHGSSNYRLLKDTVNGNAVGGYTGPDGEDPNPVVVSAETNYPVGGWLKHDAGAAQMSSYEPNYTKAMYKYGGIAPSTDPFIPNGYRTISTWCAGCHEQYDDKGAAIGSTEFYDYGLYEQADMLGKHGPDGETLTDGAGAVIGDRARHRHPVNISLAAGVGPTRALVQEVKTSPVLPLEYGPSSDPSAPWTTNDYLGCLTCHRAHGSAQQMTGWAEARYVTDISAVVTWYPQPLMQVVGSGLPTSGVNPSFSSAILRTDNRGVCERCHNK